MRNCWSSVVKCAASENLIKVSVFCLNETHLFCKRGLKIHKISWNFSYILMKLILAAHFLLMLSVADGRQQTNRGERSDAFAWFEVVQADERQQYFATNCTNIAGTTD